MADEQGFGRLRRGRGGCWKIVIINIDPGVIYIYIYIWILRGLTQGLHTLEAKQQPTRRPTILRPGYCMREEVILCGGDVMILVVLRMAYHDEQEMLLTVLQTLTECRGCTKLSSYLKSLRWQNQIKIMLSLATLFGRIRILAKTCFKIVINHNVFL